MMVAEQTASAARRWNKTLPHWITHPDTLLKDPLQAAATAASSTDGPAALEQAAKAIRERQAAHKRSAEEMIGLLLVVATVAFWPLLKNGVPPRGPRRRHLHPPSILREYFP